MIRVMLVIFIVAVTLAWGLRAFASVVDDSCWNRARVDIENLCLTPVSKYVGACRFPKTGHVETGRCIDKIIFFNREDLKTVLRENNLEDVSTGCVENVKSYVLRIPRAGVQSGETFDRVKEFLNEHPACINIKNEKFAEKLELFGPEGDTPKVYCMTVDRQSANEGEEFVLDYREVTNEGECV